MEFKTWMKQASLTALSLVGGFKAAQAETPVTSSAEPTAVVWDVRYHHRMQQYAEATPLDAFGYTTTLHGVQQTLRWSGEIATQIPIQTMALMQERLVAEASTAAWQDYFLFNALLAMVCLIPALPFWPREKYRPAAAPETAPASTPATRNGIATSQADCHQNPGQTQPSSSSTSL